MSQPSKLPSIYLIAQPASHKDLMINGYSMVILFVFFPALSLNFIRTLRDKWYYSHYKIGEKPMQSHSYLVRDKSQGLGMWPKPEDLGEEEK